jgi:hypothetical protein
MEHCSAASTSRHAESTNMPSYKVMVDDNFHYMDENERWEFGVFASAESALEVCRRLVDRSLVDGYKAGATAAELFDHYKSFGDDPFIVALDDAPRLKFSAWTYAQERAVELTAPDPEGARRRQAILDATPGASLGGEAEPSER